MAKMTGKDNKINKENIDEENLDEILENPAFELEEEQEDVSEENKEVEESKDKQIASLVDSLKRNMAEFDNFRKRTDKEKSQMYGMGQKEVIEKLLPTVDNFERALSSVPEEEKENSFTLGIDMIYKQLMTTLESMGVVEIEAIGNNFDPNLHNAVMHEENDEFGENIVAEQYQKGYMYKDTVLRHSMVKVVN
ncbi:MAG: hypothetical protein K0R15_2777 [Clostridiales bacterium]|jgi:molecular chaperone GrpE|nr:hypothetical protein [Clostridiales bacterium]